MVKASGREYIVILKIKSPEKLNIFKTLNITLNYAKWRYFLFLLSKTMQISVILDPTGSIQGLASTACRFQIFLVIQKKNYKGIRMRRNNACCTL